MLPLDGIFLHKDYCKFFHPRRRLIGLIEYLFKNTIKIRISKVGLHGTCLAVDSDDRYIISGFKMTHER